MNENEKFSQYLMLWKPCLDLNVILGVWGSHVSLARLPATNSLRRRNNLALC